MPSVLVPVQTRAVTYPRREKIYPPLPGQGERRRDDPGGAGFETVRERRCCPACARQ
ncbi:hypothetical protein [Deinococcus sp.]|uniref:hypothetical protein n=1 Tax=Deinococcus sp. TaxID=47478 RepID=UPI0025EEB806|nr:hypothetical protein [Deinococcus sp.]